MAGSGRRTDQDCVGEKKATLELTYERRDATEKVGDALGFLERRVSADLERFKRFIESRGAPTGAWRGEIHGGRVEKGSTTSTS